MSLYLLTNYKVFEMGAIVLWIDKFFLIFNNELNGVYYYIFIKNFSVFLFSFIYAITINFEKYAWIILKFSKVHCDDYHCWMQCNIVSHLQIIFLWVN